MQSNTNGFLTGLRGTLFNLLATQDDFMVLFNYQQPIFKTEDEAYVELLKLLDTIRTTEPVLAFDVMHRFFMYNLEYWFMREAPSYKLFWEVVRPTYVEDVATALQDITEPLNWDKLKEESK